MSIFNSYVKLPEGNCKRIHAQVLSTPEILHPKNYPSQTEQGLAR